MASVASTSAVTLLFLVYARVSRTALSVFDYYRYGVTGPGQGSDPGLRFYLKDDMSVVTGDGAHQVMTSVASEEGAAVMLMPSFQAAVAVAVVAIFAYVIGIPVAAVLILRNHRHTLHVSCCFPLPHCFASVTPAGTAHCHTKKVWIFGEFTLHIVVIVQLTSNGAGLCLLQYTGYDLARGLWWWEITVLFRKVLLLMCVVFIKNPAGQSLALNTVLMAAIWSQIGIRPFESLLLNVMEGLSLFALYVVSSMSLLSWMFRGAWVSLASIVSGIVVVPVVILFFYGVVRRPLPKYDSLSMPFIVTSTGCSEASTGHIYPTVTAVSEQRVSQAAPAPMSSVLAPH